MSSRLIITVAASLALASPLLRCATVTPKDALSAAAYGDELSQCVRQYANRADVDECRAKVDCAWGQGPCAAATDAGKKE